jgi:catechol 2,3-dioxygenase-like lactoylglutathione lyase family enzyme
MIPAGREDEARGFYEGLLGLVPIPRPEMENPGFWYRCGAEEVHLGIEAGGGGASSRAHVAFAVENLDTLRARLSGADFEVRDGRPLAGARRFHTRDPFGNRLEFMEAGGTGGAGTGLAKETT